MGAGGGIIIICTRVVIVEFFRLERVPGVANVAMWGERIKALVVQVDPDLLRVHNVSLNEVMETHLRDP